MSLITWDDGPHWKPKKGAAKLAKLKNRKDAGIKEDAEKAIVRVRDRKCRWPFCAYCKRYRNLVLQVAHVIEAKGMGGDSTGIRSTADLMMLLDPLTHAEQERHERVIVPLTDRGTSGPCEFWAEDKCGCLYLVAREYAIGCYEKD